DGGRVPVGPFQYAYHIDAAAVGRYLRTKADDVEIVDGVVADADLSEEGRIEALVLDDGRRVAGDFFIDCTGFRRRLISGALGAGWVSYADALPVNRAMPFWLDHDEGEIEPVTLAWAMKAGWMWRIPTQQRLGCGYVYSDRHLDPEGAKVEIETALGREIEPRADLRFDIGRLDQAWVGNCLAVGLAQSFLEPLEATSIHGTVVQLMLFSQDFMAEPFTFSPAERDDFNRRVGRQVDDFRTFINLHYVTERDDSPFWREVRDSRIHAETKKRLEVWRDEAPRAGHFESFLSGLPHVETQLYYPVLDGLGLLDRRLAQQEMEARPALRRHAREVLAKMDREFGQAARQAMGHRDFLESL
ncbi:MAG: tryptophan 7-halogenase, partial [Pseudomonadota bacterium]